MSGYRRPSDSDRITSSWQDHKDREPPSNMPGTDYGVNYGSNAYAVEDGVVTEIHKGNDGGGGRYVQYRLDDGREARAIHLSRVDVSVGQRVSRGQRIGLTGASGYGSDWYYGPHIHQTLWPHGAWDDPTIDFEKYVGEENPPSTPPSGGDDEEDEMALKGAYYVRASDGETVYLLFNEVSGFYTEHTDVSGSYNNALAQQWGTGSWPKITDSHAKVIKGNLDKVRASSAATSSEVAKGGGHE